MFYKIYFIKIYNNNKSNLITITNFDKLCNKKKVIYGLPLLVNRKAKRNKKQN